MPKQAKRNVIVAKPAATTSKPVSTTKPVVINTAPLGTAAAAQAKRSNVVKPEKPVAAVAVAKPARIAGVARTAATIAADRTNFGGIVSDRDNAYLAFYARYAKRASNGIVTVADIASGFRDHGHKPEYTGSCKPHDAGVIVRLSKAGLVKHVSDGTSFTFTDAGKKLGSYSAAKAFPG